MKLLPRTALLLLGLAILLALPAAWAGKSYGPGVSDTVIKIGNTGPYSGPQSVYGTLGRAEAAYFRMINEQGGVNGRRIEFISLDDAYNPAKTVEHTRRLVEHEEVLLMFAQVSTAANSAIHKYVNAKGVPHVFVSTGATKWADPKHYPWTMGFLMSYQTEARIYARYILENKPNARIGILYQNDDYGKDYVRGLKDGLGNRASQMIVAEQSYETTDPTVHSQIVSLKGSGADVFFDVSASKFAAQAIRKAYEIGWTPLHIMNSIGSSVGSVLTPAGLEKAVGLVTTFYVKDPSDPQWKDDPGMSEYLRWLKTYYPAGDPKDGFNVWGYLMAQGLVHVLRQCGDDLTRENVMRQMISIRDLQLPMMLPGIRWNTAPDDYFLIESARLARFDGKQWVPFSMVIGR